MKVIVSDLLVQIDEEDYRYFLRGLVAREHSPNYFVVRVRDDSGKYVNLARLLTNCPEDKVVDHIDGNGLNNSKSNLRVVTRQQNNHNTALRKDSSTGVKGVRRNGNSYVAEIRVNGQRKYLGSFVTLESADAAYKRAADKYFGEYALHNSRS